MTQLQCLGMITVSARDVAMPAAQHAHHMWATTLAGLATGSTLQAALPLLRPGTPRTHHCVISVRGEFLQLTRYPKFSGVVVAH